MGADSPSRSPRLEGGKRPIGVDELAAAAAALRVKPADFFADDLPMGSIQIVSAFQAVVRANNQLISAVRQYDSAHSGFLDVLDRSGGEFLDRLPFRNPARRRRALASGTPLHGTTWTARPAK